MGADDVVAMGRRRRRKRRCVGRDERAHARSAPLSFLVAGVSR
jgi:hypothetical protein